MRKIKFRGKCVDDGDWVYGYVIEYLTGRCFIHEPIISSVSKEDVYEYEIAPDTIGQFTGLYDKNGKEIYEGDIVKFRILDDTVGEVWKEYTDEVSFCNGCFCTHGTPLIQGKWKGHNMVNVETIGNIHDSLPNC